MAGEVHVRKAAVTRRHGGRAGQPLQRALADRAELAAALLLLAHRVDDAIDLARPAGPFGWSVGLDRHPDPVIVPFLLVGAGDAATPRMFRQHPAVALLDEANNIGCGHGGRRSVELAPFGVLVRMADARPARFEPDPPRELLLSARLFEAPAVRPVTASAAVGSRSPGRSRSPASTRSAAANTGAPTRGWRCARWREPSTALAGGGEAGAGFVDACHARHPRHSTIHGELRETAAQSPLL